MDLITTHRAELTADDGYTRSYIVVARILSDTQQIASFVSGQGSTLTPEELKCHKKA
jgi:hypothetical protein